jgi:hypothetical protein
METNRNINPEHIKIAGEKIQRCGVYLILQIFISGVFAVIIFYANSDGALTKSQDNTIFWVIYLVIILFLGFKSLSSLVDSGGHLIKSVSVNRENASTPNSKKNQKIEEEYYPNGNRKSLGPTNLEGKKHGIWECYNEDGSLGYKELYENGNWVNKIYF